MDKNQMTLGLENNDLLSSIEKLHLFRLVSLCPYVDSNEIFNSIIEELKLVIPFDYCTSTLLSVNPSGFVTVQAASLMQGREKWGEDYFEKDFYKMDTVLNEWMKQIEQGEIELQWWANTYKNTPDSEEFVALAKSYGIEDGYSIGEKISQTLGSIFSFFGPRIKKSSKTEFILELMSPFLTMALKKAPNAKLQGLTKRQTQVLELVNQGIKYEEISQRLDIKISTINKHVKAIKDKLEVSNKEEMLRLMIPKEGG